MKPYKYSSKNLGSVYSVLLPGAKSLVLCSVVHHTATVAQGLGGKTEFLQSLP